MDRSVGIEGSSVMTGVAEGTETSDLFDAARGGGASSLAVVAGNALSDGIEGSAICEMFCSAGCVTTGFVRRSARR